MSFRKQFTSITIYSVVIVFLMSGWLSHATPNGIVPYRILTPDIQENYFDVSGLDKYFVNSNVEQHLNHSASNNCIDVEPLECNHTPENIIDGDASCGDDFYNDAFAVYKFDRSFDGNGDDADIVYLKTNNFACCGEILVNPKSGNKCYDLTIAGPKGPGIEVVEGGTVDAANCDFSYLMSDCGNAPVVATINCVHSQHEEVSHKITFLGSTMADDDGYVYWYYKVENKINECQAVKGISHLSFGLLSQEVCCVPEATCLLEDVDLECQADFPPTETDIYSVFNVLSDCGQELTMEFEEVENEDTAEPGYELIQSITRTYTLFADGVQLAQCVQTLRNFYELPSYTRGDGLIPDDFNIEISGCMPEFENPLIISGTAPNLLTTCLGATRSNNLLVANGTFTEESTDCDWTILVEIYITNALGDLALAYSGTISGADDTPPVLTHTNSEMYPDGFDFGCEEPVEPTFIATDNCSDNLVPTVTPGEIVVDGCNRSQTWTATASDDCETPAEPISVTYNWIDAPAITYDILPQDATVSACDYTDGDFAQWVEDQETALNLGGGCEPMLSSDLGERTANACGDEITVTWTITDTCIDPIMASATYTITAPPAITYDILPQDATVSACDYTDGDFAQWVEDQETALNLGGG
ncbi:hypothetical protein, partial [Aestuariibaculum sediminum]